MRLGEGGRGLAKFAAAAQRWVSEVGAAASQWTRRVECLRRHLYEALEHAAEKCARSRLEALGMGVPNALVTLIPARRAHFSERRIQMAAQMLRAASPAARPCGIRVSSP